MGADWDDTWDVVQAVNWIAFRGAFPTMIAHNRDSDGDRLFPVAAALDARASGEPRSWRPDPDERYAPARQVRALARRWMRVEGLSAAELLQRFRDKPDTLRTLISEEDFNRRREDALDTLNKAVRRGELAAEGRPSETWEAERSPKPREPLPPSYVDEVRMIGWSGHLERRPAASGLDWIYLGGPYVRDIAFRMTDLKRLWPVAETGPSAQSPLPVPQNGSNRVSKRRYPTDAVRQWYIARRDNWPAGDPGSSADADEAAANKAFPGITRGQIRELRSDLAPGNWTSPGRPKTRR